MKKVSIIIPLYNHEKFVSEAIDSALAQTYENIEIIVVNDGSPGDQSVLDKYKGKITILNQENKGLSAARNNGFMESTGDYIQLLDADDVLHPDKIRLQMEVSLKNNSDISYCESADFKEDVGILCGDLVGPTHDMFFRYFVSWGPNPLFPHAVLIKRELWEKYGGFSEDFASAEDKNFFMLLTIDGVRFDYCPFVGAYKRVQHGDNMSMNHVSHFRNIVRCYNLHEDKIDKADFKNKYGCLPIDMINASLTFQYLKYLGCGICNKDLKEIRAMIKEFGYKLSLKHIDHDIMSASVPYQYLYIVIWARLGKKVYNFFKKKDPDVVG